MKNRRHAPSDKINVWVRQAPRLIGFSLAVGLPLLSAQNADSPDPIATAATLPADRPNLSPMQTLLEPVALYPDPLLAVILAASTQPDQINGDASRPAEPAVQALRHYPAVRRWMAANPLWTARVGVAFADQPARVMEAIQALRHRAFAAGSISSNSHVEVVADGGILRIVPRGANTVSIPQYSGEAVYFPGAPRLQWSHDLPAGHWLSLIPAWKHNRLEVADGYASSRNHGDRHEPMENAQPWQVSATAQIHQSRFHTPDMTVYGRPQAENTPGNDYGYLLPRPLAPDAADFTRPATFQGDQYPSAGVNSVSSSKMHGPDAPDPHPMPNQ